MIKLACGFALLLTALTATTAVMRPTSPATAPSTEAPLPEATARYPDRSVSFDHPDGTYVPDLFLRDFGNGTPAKGRDFLTVRDGHAVVTYPAGKKVSDTGLSAHTRIPDAQQVTLEYRIRYPEGFEPGLHGKQIGLSGGKGYDGGRGEEARTQGDGWSVRLQFDANADTITNQLYVYHVRMPGKYGDALGTKALRFPLTRGQWHTIKLRVTMQSAPATADGRIEVWQDGQPRFDLKDVQFVSKEEGRTINRVRFEMFPGGGGIFPTQDHEIHIDDLKWTTTPALPK